MADKEPFLKKHWDEIIQKIRNPMQLADNLLSLDSITQEIYDGIKTQGTKQAKTREILACLNSQYHFDRTYEWLKKNESGLFEELENGDTEAAAPQKKRSRHESGDETDNLTRFPETDLKEISTFAKMESWVSIPEVSQKLISDLERKLGEKGMEDLKKELNDREPKNSLCFNAKNIDDIRKNKELEVFLNAKNEAQFPTLTLNMFFKKGSSASSGKKSTDCDEPMDTTVDDLNSSGYGSNTSGLSLLNLSQNYGQTSDDEIIFRDADLNESNDNKDMQETQNIEMDGQPQPPDQCPNGSPKWANEPMPKNETLLEDTHGSMDMQENEEANVQDNSEPCPSKLLQKNSPASASDNVSSRGSWETQKKIEAEIIAQNMDTPMPAPEETQNTAQERDGSSMGFNTSTSGAVKDQTGEPSCSKNEAALGTNKTVRRKKNNPKKRNHRESLLHDWAKKQCNGSKEESKNILNQISIINKAEHSDYPCFTAENIIVYKNPTTQKRQIIFISEEKISSTTKTMVHYFMFVCGINKAMLVCTKEQNEQEIEYDESFTRINKCIRFIFEAFAPALAVFKKIQKEKLCSLI